jgi:chromosome segregation ATPase
MALNEAARQKDELRDTAASLLAELRDTRARADVAEGFARRSDRERAVLEERVASFEADEGRLTANLVAAQAEAHAAFAANEERELQMDSLQMHVFELRTALSRARGFEQA